MDCRRIQDLIITDYIDNELDVIARQEIERHVSACPDCRAFREALALDVTGPLRNAPAVRPPETLWPSIRNILEQRKRAAGDMGLRELLSFLRPAWFNAAALATMLVLALAAGNFFASGIWAGESPEPAYVEADAGPGLGMFNDISGELNENEYAILGG